MKFVKLFKIWLSYIIICGFGICVGMAMMQNDYKIAIGWGLLDGLLCRWDNANVCSYDNGKTWVDRPATAVKMHPGQDIQCRCVSLAYIPELLFEMGENT